MIFYPSVIVYIKKLLTLYLFFAILNYVVRNVLLNNTERRWRLSMKKTKPTKQIIKPEPTKEDIELLELVSEDAEEVFKK